MPAEDFFLRNGSILTTRARLRRMSAGPELPKLYAPSTAGERSGRICLAVIGAAVCLSIGYAVLMTATTPPAHRTVAAIGNAPQPGVVHSGPVVPCAPLPVATDPLRWEDLTLMLRAGFRDDEIIAEAARKQLVTSIDPLREETLRRLGASTQLVNYLRSRRVYAAPATIDAARVVVTAQPVTIAMAASQPAYQPTPDYAARDRQIQSLKTQVDALDEQIRCIRTNPKDNRYWWHYSGSSNGIDQQKLDAYLNQLDVQRNELRRQKWQLEGR